MGHPTHLLPSIARSSREERPEAAQKAPRESLRARSQPNG